MSPNLDQVSKLKVRKLDRRLVEVVISMKSDLIGKTVRESRFRSRFRAAIIAVHRSGNRVLSKIGDIELRAGDVLILDTGPYFVQRFRDDVNFLLVAEIENSTPPRFDKFYIALIAVIGMMALYTGLQDYLSLFECAVFAAAVMVVFDIISPQRARSAISWDVIVTIACAFGLSTAMENSDVAQTIGQALVDLAVISGTGEIGIIVAVYFATFMLSIVIANNAAALLMFPIATQAIQELNLDETTILFTLMLAASSSFTSPFGYQTNLMVYGPGQYTFMDFVKFGLPMQFWQMVFSVTVLYHMNYWYISWAAAFVGFVVVVFIRIQLMRRQRKKMKTLLEKADDAKQDDDLSTDTPSESKDVKTETSIV